jgi:hypothetical protein
MWSVQSTQWGRLRTIIPLTAPAGRRNIIIIRLFNRRQLAALHWDRFRTSALSRMRWSPKLAMDRGGPTWRLPQPSLGSHRHSR